jgi:hypothetical protein
MAIWVHLEFRVCCDYLCSCRRLNKQPIGRCVQFMPITSRSRLCASNDLCRWQVKGLQRRWCERLTSYRSRCSYTGQGDSFCCPSLEKVFRNLTSGLSTTFFIPRTCCEQDIRLFFSAWCSMVAHEIITCNVTQIFIVEKRQSADIT